MPAWLGSFLLSKNFDYGWLPTIEFKPKPGGFSNAKWFQLAMFPFQSCLSSSPDFSLQQRQALASGNGTICVFIQLPVEDLRQLALRTVRQNVSKKEDCFCLDVPLSIQFELAQMFVWRKKRSWKVLVTRERKKTDPYLNKRGSSGRSETEESLKNEDRAFFWSICWKVRFWHFLVVCLFR